MLLFSHFSNFDKEKRTYYEVSASKLTKNKLNEKKTAPKRHKDKDILLIFKFFFII